MKTGSRPGVVHRLFPIGQEMANQTLRQFVRISVGGKRVRIRGGLKELIARAQKSLKICVRESCGLIEPLHFVWPSRPLCAQLRTLQRLEWRVFWNSITIHLKANESSRGGIDLEYLGESVPGLYGFTMLLSVTCRL